jgi:hypothetical protein
MLEYIITENSISVSISYLKDKNENLNGSYCIPKSYYISPKLENLLISLGKIKRNIDNYDGYNKSNQENLNDLVAMKSKLNDYENQVYEIIRRYSTPFKFIHKIENSKSLKSISIERASISDNIKIKAKFSNNTEKILYGIPNGLSSVFIESYWKKDIFNRKFLNFMEDILTIKSEQLLNNLMEFIKVNTLKIDEDGCLVLLKYVSNLYRDCWSGKFDNHPGRTVIMKRSECNDNLDLNCSSGLHLASEEFIKQVGALNDSSKKIVQCKVKIKDIVAVPNNNEGKIRCCKYKVEKELTPTEKANIK